MGPPGGARNAVDPRFASLFSVFEIEAPSADSLRAIYGTILGRHLTGMPQEVRGAVGAACAVGQIDQPPACLRNTTPHNVKT